MSVLSQALGDGRERRARDYYPTIDARAIPPLMEHVRPGTLFAEPMAGANDLVQLLCDAGLVCEWAMDIEPQHRSVAKGDVLTLNKVDLALMDSKASCFITNPMWDRSHLHRFIPHLAGILPTWFLFDANWMQTAAARCYGDKYCTDVVAVGRLRWFPPPPRRLRISGESEADYKKRCKKGDNDPPTDCAWYRFDAAKDAPTQFHWRCAKIDKKQGLLL